MMAPIDNLEVKVPDFDGDDEEEAMDRIHAGQALDEVADDDGKDYEDDPDPFEADDDEDDPA